MSHSRLPRQPLDRPPAGPSGGPDLLAEALGLRGTVLVGGFGDGKTEIAIALARHLRRSGYEPYLIDLDIVTPYFRPRDIAHLLTEEGVTVVAPSGEVALTDIPAVVGSVPHLLTRAAAGTATVVVDPGGDAPGVGVIRSLVDPEQGRSLVVPYVLNMNRELAARGRAEETRRAIEIASGLRVTHLIANTHLGRATTTDVVLGGVDRARELAEEWGLPLLGVGVLERLASEVAQAVADLPVIVVPPSLGLPWDDHGALSHS